MPVTVQKCRIPASNSFLYTSVSSSNSTGSRMALEKGEARNWMFKPGFHSALCSDLGTHAEGDKTTDYSLILPTIICQNDTRQSNDGQSAMLCHFSSWLSLPPISSALYWDKEKMHIRNHCSLCAYFGLYLLLCSCTCLSVLRLNIAAAIESCLLKESLNLRTKGGICLDHQWHHSVNTASLHCPIISLNW